MNKNVYILFGVIIMLLTITGCQKSKDDLIKNTIVFNEDVFAEDYKSNQKSAYEEYKNNKYLFFGYVDSIEDDYAIIKTQNYDYHVYFSEKELLNLKNNYFIRFVGNFANVDSDTISVKKVRYVDDNVDLLGKISVEDNWHKKGCYLEIDDTSTLLNDVEYFGNGGYCLYNGKSLNDGESVIVNGRVKFIDKFKEYKIETINSIEYENAEKNEAVKDGISDRTKVAFKSFGISFDDLDIKYNYLDAEYVNGKNSYTNNPAPELNIYVYLKDKLSDEERKVEYNKILNYLKSISADGKIYDKASRDVYVETAELKISNVGFVNYFKIGNGMYMVELYNRGDGGSINSTHYKDYYLLHFFNYDPQ